MALLVARLQSRIYQLGLPLARRSVPHRSSVAGRFDLAETLSATTLGWVMANPDLSETLVYQERQRRARDLVGLSWAIQTMW